MKRKRDTENDHQPEISAGIVTTNQAVTESSNPTNSSNTNTTTTLRNSDSGHNGNNKLTLIRCDSEMTQISVAPVSSSAEIHVPTAHAGTQIKFERTPKTVLLIKQWKSDLSTKTLLEIANFLATEYEIRCVIEQGAKQDIPSLDIFSENDEIDFCVVLGGDGTLLHLNSLFQAKRSVPPVLPLAQGSLGFMMPYSYKQYKDHIKAIMSPSTPIHITLRTRLFCEYWKADDKAPSLCYQVLNEVLVYRGKSPYLTKIEFFVNDALVTCIQADGVVISTPSGSTAYSLSAGGSLMPPEVPAILLTPACPHSLSFRPIVLPDSCVLKLRISDDARASALATCDGRIPTDLNVGDYLIIKTSPWPLPTFSLVPPMVEWFRSIRTRLNWNVRELQKGFQRKQGDGEEEDEGAADYNTH